MRLRHTIGFSLVLLVMSGGAMTKPALANDNPTPAKKHHVAEGKAKPDKAGEHRRHAQAKPQKAALRTAARHRRHHRRHAVGDEMTAAAETNEDRIIGPVKLAGAEEIGSASWYGGRHLGRRTASGERLDAIHATAAHRSLPLYSLARVTNLDNGLSVIVRVTDRGPVSPDLVIDLSPSAAEQLEMKDAGIVPVTVEPVVLVADEAD